MPEYGCTIVQLPPGAASQNWYIGLEQPEATAVKMTPVPDPCGEVGAAESVTDVHGTVPKVNWSAAVCALVPAGVVTSTSTTPAACAGLVAVTWESVLTVKPVAAVAPKWTDVAPVNPQPVMTTLVPPNVEPEVGAMPVTVAAPR